MTIRLDHTWFSSYFRIFSIVVWLVTQLNFTRRKKLTMWTTAEYRMTALCSTSLLLRIYEMEFNVVVRKTKGKMADKAIRAQIDITFRLWSLDLFVSSMHQHHLASVRHKDTYTAIRQTCFFSPSRTQSPKWLLRRNEHCPIGWKP